MSCRHDAVSREFVTRAEMAGKAGPLPQFNLAGFIDIDDNDPLVERARHRQLNSYVVEVILDSIDDLEAWLACNVYGENDEGEVANRDSYQEPDPAKTRCGIHGDNLHEKTDRKGQKSMIQGRRTIKLAGLVNSSKRFCQRTHQNKKTGAK
jgi:hypothetical protein